MATLRQVTVVCNCICVGLLHVICNTYMYRSDEDHVILKIVCAPSSNSASVLTLDQWLEVAQKN